MQEHFVYVPVVLTIKHCQMKYDKKYFSKLLWGLHIVLGILASLLFYDEEVINILTFLHHQHLHHVVQLLLYFKSYWLINLILNVVIYVVVKNINREKPLHRTVSIFWSSKFSLEQSKAWWRTTCLYVYYMFIYIYITCLYVYYMFIYITWLYVYYMIICILHIYMYIICLYVYYMFICLLHVYMYITLFIGESS